MMSAKIRWNNTLLILVYTIWEKEKKDNKKMQFQGEKYKC